MLVVFSIVNVLSCKTNKIVIIKKVTMVTRSKTPRSVLKLYLHNLIVSREP